MQIQAMKNRYPQFKVLKRGQFDIVFTGTLIVRPVFPLYTVAINYLGESKPLVRILKPELVPEPPHFYQECKSLCLYHPRNYRWTKEKLIAKDMVPWAAGWIFFYEKWLQSGKWYGPEADHYDGLLIPETN